MALQKVILCSNVELENDKRLRTAQLDAIQHPWPNCGSQAAWGPMEPLAQMVGNK
jgi:hypothetical protein